MLRSKQGALWVMWRWRFSDFEIAMRLDWCCVELHCGIVLDDKYWPSLQRNSVIANKRSDSASKMSHGAIQQRPLFMLNPIMADCKIQYRTPVTRTLKLLQCKLNFFIRTVKLSEQRPRGRWRTSSAGLLKVLENAGTNLTVFLTKCCKYSNKYCAWTCKQIRAKYSSTQEP